MIEMCDCFISYSRSISASLAWTIETKLIQNHDIKAYLDTSQMENTTVPFPERLITAIEQSPVFICILGEKDSKHTLESEWVRREIDKAYELKKFCIPVFHENYRPLSNSSDAIDYLLQFDAISIFDNKGIMIDASIRDLAKLIRAQNKRPKGNRYVLFVIGLVLLFSVLFILILYTNNNDRNLINSTEIANNLNTLDLTEIIGPLIQHEMNVLQVPILSNTTYISRLLFEQQGEWLIDIQNVQGYGEYTIEVLSLDMAVLISTKSSADGRGVIHAQFQRGEYFLRLTNLSGSLYVNISTYSSAMPNLQSTDAYIKPMMFYSNVNRWEYCGDELGIRNATIIINSNINSNRFEFTVRITSSDEMSEIVSPTFSYNGIANILTRMPMLGECYHVLINAPQNGGSYTIFIEI